jgi:endoglucanase
MLVGSVISNMRFTTSLLAVGTAAMVVALPSMSLKKRVKNFTWFGVNESGAEFGSGDIPGVLGTDYIWPVTYVQLLTF